MQYLNSQYTAMTLPYLAWISIQSHMTFLSVPMYWNTLSLNSLLWSLMTKPASGSCAPGACLSFVPPPKQSSGLADNRGTQCKGEAPCCESL